ncbi:hypothetical protein D3C81_640780 [compost metagenome]
MTPMTQRVKVVDDYPITRLPDYPITRLPDHPINYQAKNMLKPDMLLYRYQGVRALSCRHRGWRGG